MRSIADRNDWVSYRIADFHSEEGRPIPFLHLSSSSSFGGSSNITKLKVYIHGGIHGNEPAGDQGALAFLGKLDSNQTYATFLLERMDIMIVPRYNADGVSYFQRALASNFDPNREHIKLDRPQSRNLKRVFSDFNPHVAIDLHEFTASTVFGGKYQHANDGYVQFLWPFDQHVLTAIVSSPVASISTLTQALETTRRNS